MNNSSGSGSFGSNLQVWGVRSLIPAIGGLLCLAFAGWLIVAGSPEDRLVAGAGVCVSAIASAILLTMRQRLIADDDGFTLRGPVGARHVTWGQVVAISSPTRRRRGLASTSVELDLDDDGLIVLGKTELGADPVDVAQDLRQWWTAGR
ncbi:hypothetical protein ABIB25_002888 [Nakamurella sp. UYEF19]|uniref:PH domain-containing protein n=1 Tax=Nakamurella sp. UYEF19 TaxID=1756392 RepID=UPI003391DEC1